MPAGRSTLTSLAADYAAAWSSKSPEAVAGFYAPDGQIVINRGEALKGRAAVADMAGGFYDAYPDLVVHCDGVRQAGSHAIFLWTFEGHHAETGNKVTVSGWEEWDLNDDLQVVSSLGWFDAEEEARQIAGPQAG